MANQNLEHTMLPEDSTTALEASLRQRELDLARAYRIARLGTWHWVKATDTVTWSEEVFRAFDLDPNLPPPGYRELQAMHTPESRERLHQAVQRAVLFAEPYEIDVEIVTPAGVRKWMIARGEAVATVDGEVKEIGGTIQDITDRKRIELQLQDREDERRLAETALNETRSRFERISQLSLVGLCFPDRFGAFFEGNDEFLRIVGYTREELEAGLVRWDTMTPPQYDYLDVIGIAEAAQFGRCTPYEKEYIRKDGTLVPILCGYALLEGSEDNYIGFILDISARKQAEQAQRTSEEMYRIVGENLDYGVWACDAQGRNTYASDSFLKLVGLTQQQCSEFGWGSALHPDESKSTLARWKHCVETGGDWDVEHRFRGTDGRWHPVLARGKAVRNAAGEVTGWAGINLDLARLKEVETAIREREQRFSALADTIPQLVWMSSPTGDKIYVNRRFLEYTGIASEAIDGPLWPALVHPDDADRTMALRLQCIRSGEPYLDEFRIRRHDGLYRTFLVRAIPVRNETSEPESRADRLGHGEIARWLGSATDIHDRKLAEDALRRSEKLAATGRLAASIAHEINNPLEAVTNSLYLALMDDKLDAETRHYLEVAEQELKRVAHVTTQTLRFHRQSVAAAKVDLAEIMDSAFSLFAPRFTACAISVGRDYAPGQLLFCRGDEVRQVFTNFLSNALDATRQGGRVRIRIRPACRRSGTQARPGFRVTIADTGHGIPLDLRRTIFEPFISTKETTGTGLGLWVSDGIVQKHKGHISLRSRTESPYHGTVFSLFFPIDGIQTTPATA